MRELRENEYVRDGTIYCSVCNTPKQVMIHTKRGLLIVEPGCKCVEESRNLEERRKREVIIQRNTKCCFKDYGEEQKRAYSRTLEELEENEYVDKAKGYADHFEDFSRDGIGLLLTGGVGTGKSTIAAGIANTLLQNGYTARFTNFSYIAEELEGLKGYEKVEKLMKLVRHTVLCNNIADTAGSDVYLKKSPLVLPSAPSMNSIYLGAPEDVRNQKIDGWYEDKTDSRYTEQEKAARKEYTGYASIDGSGEVALIAAANPSLVHIKFINEDGSTVYKESYYPLGTTAKDIILPDATKASDEKYDYIFKGWSPAIKDATEDAVYTAVFEKVFKQFTVQYEFKSLTADKELPEEVTALLPKDPAGYGRGTDIKAIAPAKTEVKVDGGTWTFKGFDKDSKKATMENADGDGNVKFTGTWEFTPKNPDPLPSTGGIGTHLFIIVGAALMAAAAIALARNSKNSNKTK